MSNTPTPRRPRRIGHCSPGPCAELGCTRTDATILDSIGGRWCERDAPPEDRPTVGRVVFADAQSRQLLTDYREAARRSVATDRLASVTLRWHRGEATDEELHAACEDAEKAEVRG